MNVALPHLTFVLGGARSGKSRYAEGLVMDCAPPWIYIATAEVHDGEMSAKIATTGTGATAGGARSRPHSICPARSQHMEMRNKPSWSIVSRSGSATSC